MTYVYSSNAYGFTEQVMEDFMKPRAVNALMDGREFEWGDDDGFRAALWMGHAVYRAVSDLLPLVHKGMQWLQGVAGLLASEGLPVEFETPLGWPVKIEKKSVAKRNMHVALTQGRRMQVLMYGESGMSRRMQRSSTPPNTIHACDACHLHMVANGMTNMGIPDFLLVHDEFAAHAGSMDELARSVRDAMVLLYADWSPFWGIYEAAGMRLSDNGFRLLQGEKVEGDDRTPLGPPPAVGGLNLWGILRADYAFA